MAQITEDYVSFETAKLLKEKGFYQDFLSEITPVWKLNGNRTELAFYGCDNYPCETDEWYSAPTLQMAMKWLRDIHNLDIIAPPQFDDSKWTYSAIIFKLSVPCTEIRLNDNKDKKEEAYEAAIKYCLENLI